MDENNNSAILAISKKLEWIWITGNHDPDLPEMLPGAILSTLNIGTILLQHQPANNSVAGEHICGHLHPVARVNTPRGRLRRRCFVTDGRQLILPAFGSLTGGLNIKQPAFADLFEKRFVTAYVLGVKNVYAIGNSHLLDD